MNYRVSIQGAGFHLRGHSGTYGFLTHCFVVAESQELARQQALASVREKLDASIMDRTASPGDLRVEDLVVVTGELPVARQQGLIWFDETEA